MAKAKYITIRESKYPLGTQNAIYHPMKFTLLYKTPDEWANLEKNDT